MLINTLRNLLGRPQAPVARISTEQQVRDFIREKRYQEAAKLLEKAESPAHTALLAEVRYHQRRHEEAEQLCYNALRRQPEIAEAHYVLSMLYYDTERFEDAMAQAQFARKCAPGEGRILAQHGLCSIAVGNYGLALQVLRQAVLIEPENVPALNNLGIAHHALQETDEALYCFQSALTINREYAPARENLRTLFGIEEYSNTYNDETGALQSSLSGNAQPGKVNTNENSARLTEELESIFDTNPHDIDAAVALVKHYLDHHQIANARDILNIALAREPDSPRLIHLVGRIAQILGHQNDALAAFEHGLKREPGNVEMLLDYSHVLRDMEKTDEALTPMEKAASLDDAPGVLLNLAFAQSNACRYPEALATCDRVEQLRPELAPFMVTCRAVSHAYLGNFDKSLQYIDEAQRYETRNAGFVIFRGMIHLLHERYAEGWQCYKHRALFQTQLLRLLPYPVWRGEPLRGKSILLLAEQGLGDQVMFASCLPDLLAMEPKEVVMEAHARVEKTLARSFPTIHMHASSQTGFEWLPKDANFDYYAPMAELAAHFRRDKADFPEHDGYLRADPERVAYWRKRLDESGPGPKIGITWRGGLQQTRRVVRSLRLDQLSCILANANYQFVNLQYGNIQDELTQFAEVSGLNILNWPEAIADLDEFAALISALDLVITVCNTTVHYAGALAKPCWVMAPFIPEWRYGISSARMRWYPSTRMFRQRTPGDWEGVLEQVASALERFPEDL